MVVCERLDDHPGAVGRERLVDVRGRADRVAHVVQAIEYAHEVVVAAGIVLRRGDREARAPLDPGLLGELARALDRGVVIVEAEELRVGKGFGHDHRRSPVTAADVGHLGSAFELLLHSLERGDPLADEVALIPRPEETLGAAEQAVVVFVPAHALAAAKGLEDLVFVGVQRGDRVVHPEDVEGAVFVG